MTAAPWNEAFPSGETHEVLTLCPTTGPPSSYVALPEKLNFRSRLMSCTSVSPASMRTLLILVFSPLPGGLAYNEYSPAGTLTNS